MKKCMNHSDDFVEESLEGIYRAYQGFYEKGNGNCRALVHQSENKQKVKIVTGGGYGHLPLFLGYVGEGLCDATAVGNVFTSPSCETILDTVKAMNTEQGVLFLFGNYFGDAMNFEMAKEMLEFDGIQAEIIKASDDIASAPRSEYKKRRGIAGIAFSYKIAGEAAREGKTLEEVKAIAEKVGERTATYGIAFSSCTLPGEERPIFEINDLDMEIGMGIHGEPGIRRSRMMSSAGIARELCPAIIKDLELEKESRIAVLINGLGMTSREELYLLFKDVSEYLDEKQIVVAKTMIGEYATSLEMAGLSISFLKLDDELERLLKKQEYTPFLRY